MKGITKDGIEKDFNVVKEMLRKYSDAIWEGQTPKPSHFDNQNKLVKICMGDVRCGLVIAKQALEKLAELTDIVREFGFSPIISTNNPKKELIVKLLPYFDWIQVTVHSDKQIEFYCQYKDKINIKLSGDKNLTLEKLNHFIDVTKDFERKSISMYFTPLWKELCTDEEVWSLLNKLSWTRNGSYVYTFYQGVRIKRCIHGETNLVDEPSVPKLYPNGNYNKTWNNETLDDYLK